MPKSSAAKEMRAKQKAEVRAAKERKKNSDDPRDWSTSRQIRMVFKETAKYDRKMVPLAIAAFAIPVVIFLILGLVLTFALGWPWFNLVLNIIIGILIGLILVLQVLGRRAKSAQFAKYEGQAGSAEVALQMLGKGWTSKPAVAFNKQQDLVHRAIGPNGVILVGEGETNRVRALLATESKRHEQALYNVKPITIIMGEKDGQVPLKDLAKHISKLPKTLAAPQIAEAVKRLDALDATRGRMPLPKGPMPTRVSRSAMRGR